MASLAPAGHLIEIGTSAGYSALWLSLACREKGATLVTYELMQEKVRLARETFRVAGVQDVVELVAGDALVYLPHVEKVAFCFLDAEKEIYAACYEEIIPKLVSGGLLIADNAIDHQATLQPVIDRAMHDERIDALILPVGKGELVCRKI
jgi:predicted O-methyltransferase YrrM